MPDTAPHDHKLDLSTTRAANRVDRMLDDALEDSFSTSDPVSFAMPHNRIESKLAQLGAAPLGTLLLLGGALLAVIAVIAARR